MTTRDLDEGPENYDIPAGHSESDMRDTSCNISLNRRRDLSLRSDIRLHNNDGDHTLRDLFRVSQQNRCQYPRTLQDVQTHIGS